VPRSVRGNTNNHDEAVRAFNDAGQGTDPTEIRIALAVAQYHATMATYETGLQIAARLDALTTLLASAPIPTATPDADEGT